MRSNSKRTLFLSLGIVLQKSFPFKKVFGRYPTNVSALLINVFSLQYVMLYYVSFSMYLKSLYLQLPHHLNNLAPHFLVFNAASLCTVQTLLLLSVKKEP